MHRYTIEKVKVIRHVALYEVYAPSEEHALIKINELTPDRLTPVVLAEEVNVLSDENLEE
jgi:hypothetical protein